ncbi:hypothetical protein FRB94_003921 [Tulasnella sp. JGI-2019a]|nr:hypothetical protein FRB93_009248 [Tulasnella sp. JGI-2019a]KAG9013088.1 hypothetical protein FRB94_003921 [Tulasnella sp. JGI-2019a]KAG9032770.1 hypothetical protein FRB95_001030 [Tulasnella sp. JGI-2019a]
MSARNETRGDLRQDEPIYVVQRGLGRERKPLYCIIRHIPAKGKGFFVGEADFRCCDVWREVFGVTEQGCYYTQFYDDPEHLR